MAPPVDVAGPCPRLGDVEAPPRSRSSLSSVVEVESVFSGLGRVERSSSSSGAEPKSEPWVRRSGVRRLPGLSPSPSPGSGGAEFAVFRGLARVRALGRAERSFRWCAAGPDCLSASLCQVAPQSEWRRRRCLPIRLVSGAAK
jgi:hypothetical protein